MATTWAQVITAALVEIDDVRLQEQLAVSPSQFYRRMAQMVTLAVPLASRPPVLLRYIKKGLVRPEWDDYEWTATDESSMGPVTVDTGKTGFELCSCVVLVPQDNGSVAYLPYQAAEYDPDTGAVTFREPTQAGATYMLDFYKDGAFPDLTDTQMRILALAVAVVWDERFSRNFLAMFPKIKDESFETVNEASYTAQITKRLHENRVAFNDELKKYEQDCYYNAKLNGITGNVALF